MSFYNTDGYKTGDSPRSQAQMIHAPIMLDLNHLRVIQIQLFPNRIHIRSIKITRAVPSLPIPDQLIIKQRGKSHPTHPTPHVFRPRDEIDHLAFFRDEQSVVRTVPGSILRIRRRVFRHAAESLVPSDGGKITPVRVDDVVHSLRGGVSGEEMQGGAGVLTLSYASFTRGTMMIRPYPALK